MEEALIRHAAAHLRRASRCFISTGAGISKESGVPTFRDALTGLWEQYDPEELATPQAFLRDPDRVWSWYWMRAQQLKEVEPNPGHYAIAEIQGLLPNVTLFTQNTDELHARAGSPEVIELHGNLSRYRCFDHCRGEPTIIDIDDLVIDEGVAPRCPYCKKAYVRPDEIWFNEPLSAGLLDRAYTEAGLCDVMIVVGTSGVVQPAASLPFVARESGAKIIEFNLNHSAITSIADIFIKGPSGSTLPRLVATLRESESS